MQFGFIYIAPTTATSRELKLLSLYSQTVYFCDRAVAYAVVYIYSTVLFCILK